MMIQAGQGRNGRGSRGIHGDELNELHPCLCWSEPRLFPGKWVENISIVFIVQVYCVTIEHVSDTCVCDFVMHVGGWRRWWKGGGDCYKLESVASP